MYIYMYMLRMQAELLSVLESAQSAANERLSLQSEVSSADARAQQAALAVASATISAK